MKEPVTSEHGEDVKPGDKGSQCGLHC
jgi:hypothetical protein